MAGRLELMAKDGTVFDLLPPYEAYYAEAIGDNTDLSTDPDITTVDLFSQLAEGAATAISAVGNTELTIALRFTSRAGSVGLTDLEQQLSLVTAQPAALTYAHSDGTSPATVWDVQVAKLVPTFDVTSEGNLKRNWTLTLTCWPWPRSEELWVAEAIAPVPASPVTTTLDACTSTSGWAVTETNGTTPTLFTPATGASSGVEGTVIGVNNTTITLTKSGVAWNVSGMPYLKFQFGWNMNAGGIHAASLVFEINGTVVSPVAVIRSTVAGTDLNVATFWLPIPEGTTTISTLSATGPATSIPGTAGQTFLQVVEGPVRGLRIAAFHVDVTNDSPFSSDARKQNRTVTVPGTKAADAILQISATDMSDGVTNPTRLGGQVLIYTSTDIHAVTPNLDAYRTFGPTRTPSTTMLSGASNTMAANSTSADTYTIPVDQLPAGEYLLLAKVASTTGAAAAATINYSAALSTTGVGVPAQTGAVPITAPAVQTIVPLAILELPTTRLESGSSVNQVLTLWASSGSVALDLPFLVKIDTGQLSLIDTSDPAAIGGMASGGPFSGLIYSAPGSSPSSDTPSYEVVSTDGDIYDASFRVQSWANHQFKPGPCLIFTALTTAEALTANQVDVAIAAYPRWQAFAGTVPAVPVAEP